MRFRQINLRKLWLSLLLLVGATAIAVPGIQEVMDENVAKIGSTKYRTLQEAVDDAYANMTGDITVSLISDNCSATDTGNFINISGGAGDFNISNCSFESASWKPDGYAVRLQQASTAKVALTGNELSASEVIICKATGEGASINVESGSYLGAITKTNGTVSISGGTFSQPVDDYITAAGYGCFGNADGTFTVKIGTAVASIGDKKFDNLQTAFDAAQDGETVKLLTDVDATSTMYSGDSRFNLWVNKSITIDGNNHTLTVNGRGIGIQGASSNIDVTFNDITVKNNAASGRCIDTRGKVGKLELINSTLSTEGKEASQPLTIGGNQADAATVNITNSTIATSEDGKYGYAITTFNPVNMTIDGSTIKGWACLNIKAASSSAGSNGSVFTITNSELTSKNVYPGETNAYSVIKIEDVDVTVNVTNTTINVNGASNNEAIVGYEPGNTNGSIVNLGEGNNVNFTGTTDFAHNDDAASKLLISGGTFNKPVPEENCAEGYIPTDLGNGKYSVKVGQYVAQIVGGAKYETLQAAINAAADGNTVTLLTDINMGATAVNINKGITLDGDGYTITSTANAAVEVSGTGNVTISDTKINATNGRGVQVGNVAHYSGQLTINEGTVITVAKRGINILDVDEGFALNVDGSIIQTNVADPTTTYTTGEDSRGINFSNDPLAFTANITNSEIRGFSYCTNIYSGTENLTLNITGGKTYGRDVVNNWGKNNTFNLDGVEVHGLNNQTGPTEAFACIVENTGSANNNYNINNCQFISTLSEAAQNAANSSASEYMIDLRGNNTKVVITGTTTYTTNAPEKGGFIEYEPYIDNNTIMMDETAANTFANAFKDYKVVSTNEEPGYIVNKKNYVAQIGEGESAKKYESLEAAWAEVQDGETITLLADCAGNGIKVTEPKFAATGLTVDFAGHTYTVVGTTVGSSGTETQAFHLEKDNKITFKNGTIYSEKAKMLVQNYSDLTLEGMTLTLANANYTSAYTLSNNNGNVVIDGTTINANPAGGFAFDVCRYSSYPSVSVTVKGESIINGDVEVSASGSDAKDGFSLMLESGNITGNIVVDATARAAIEATPDKAVIKENDSFNQAAPAGFKWVSNGDGTSTLTPMPYVAQIGDVKYWSLADAVAAVPANGTETTITMIANEMINVVGYAVTIPATKNVVLDLNGYQVVGTAGEAGTSALIRNLGTLTIKDSSDTNKDGSGTGKLMSGASTTWTWDGTDDYSGSYASNLIRNEKDLIVESGLLYTMSKGSAAYAIDNYSAGNVTINGGKVDAAKASAIRMFYVNGGSISVTGGVIGHYVSDDDYSYMGIQVMGGTNANVTVTGGTLAGMYALYAGNSGGDITISDGLFDGYVGFAAAVPNINITGGSYTCWVGTWGEQTKFISGGLFAEEVDDEAQIADGYIFTTNTDEATKDIYPYTVKPGKFVAQIEGGAKYETLQDAVNAAGTAATTITLLTEAATDGVISGDGVVVPSGSNITFDLNGLTYDVSGETVGSSGTKTSGFQLLQGSDITFKNGTLKATSPTAQMLIQNYSNLTLEDVNLDGTALSGWAYALSNNCGTINLTGSTSITAKSGGRAFDTCKFGSYAIPTVNINTTGVISGPIEATGGKLNIENGKFNVTWVTDSHYAAGDIQIKGGVFAEEPDEEYCASGYITTDNEDEATKAEYPFAVMTKEDAGIFELKDWEKYPYLAYTEDKEAESVTYIRRFGNTNWQALFIPFDINDVSKLTDRYEFAKIHMVALENDGQWTTGDKIEVYYTKITSGKIYANKPYLIKAKKTGEQSIVVDNTTLRDTHGIEPMTTSTMAADYIFTGTYVGAKATSQNTFFAMGRGTINYCDDVDLGAYRWYIKPDPKGDNYAKPSISFTEADEDATSISSANDDENNEIEGYYSVNGVRSDVPVKGMNIVKYKNGKTKKIMIK